MPNYNKIPYSDSVADIITTLADIRKQQGISIRSLASDIGVYPNSVEQWLNPNTDISIDNLVCLGNALGVTFSTSNTRSCDCSAERLVYLLLKEKARQSLSTRDLSLMTGITQPHISNILSHKTMPRLNAYISIANALGIELELHMS